MRRAPFNPLKFSHPANRTGVLRSIFRFTPAVLALWFFSVLTGCQTSPEIANNRLQRFEFSQAQMGLDFRITVFAEFETNATAAVKAAYARIAELNAILSDYDSDSEISRLSRTSGTDRWVPVGNDLWTILEAGQKLSAESNGAFDLAIGPSVNLWRRARRQRKLPATDLLKLMHERVGYQFVQLHPDERAAKLTQPKMRLDAGGIAKGYAMDEAMNILRSMNFPHAMIRGGGDMVFGEPPPGKNHWRIQLTESNSPALLLSNCALATSGDLVQNLEIDGVRYSHIVDPRTGIGLTNRSLVHVIAPNGLTADSFSTTLNILERVEARRLLSKHPDVLAQITSVHDGNKTTTRTPGFAEYLE